MMYIKYVLVFVLCFIGCSCKLGLIYIFCVLWYKNKKRELDECRLLLCYEDCFLKKRLFVLCSCMDYFYWMMFNL